MKKIVYGAALVAMITATSSLTPAFAQDPNAYYYQQHRAPAREIPMIDTSRQYTNDESQVNFVTGGIGDDERQAIEAAKASYNVHVTNASIDGAFVEDTQVIIRTKNGDEILNVEAGPLLYVQLAPGSYTLEATHGDEVKKKNIVIGKKTKANKVHLGWKVPATIAGE